MSNITTTEKGSRESEIVSLLQVQDSQGLVLLYEHYSPALYHIVLRIVRREEVAQEVLQDVFVKIWKQSKSYDVGKGRLFTWMSRIAKNAAIDKTRSKNYKSTNRTDSIENFVGDSVDFSNNIKLKDSGLRKVVSQLDDKYHEIIDYLYFKDFTQSETSEALGIPLGTVKSRSRLALKALRQLLQNEQFLLPIILILSELV